MNVANKSLNTGLAAAGLVILCGVQSGLAGYNANLTPQGVGQVGASMVYTSTPSQAPSPDNYTRPSAGVTLLGTWTAKAPQPPGTPLICTSTVSTVLYPGGYKALARAYTVAVTTYDAAGNPIINNVIADNPKLSKKLADEKYVLTPSGCGASYDITSGDEVIDGQRYLVVLGKATGGTATWFQGYVYTGTLGTRDDIIQNGTKVYDAVVLGPFDFGDPDSPDRCKAFKLPIYYPGPNLYMISDGIAAGATDLRFVNVPPSVSFGCSDPLVYPALQTSGGCGSVNITYDPPANLLPPGGSTVTATATDSAGNVTTIQFAAVRGLLQFNGFDSPLGGIGGTCAAPLRKINAGNKIPIKFDTTFCGTPYQSPVPPNITITKLDKTTCAKSDVIINHQYFQWVANQWHFNWNTLVKDKGMYLIEVELGGGGTNPSAIVQLQ